MNSWHLIYLPALSAWTALLEADAVLIGQTMISRPILVGPVVGLLCGALPLGLVCGTLAEFFCAEQAPVGATMPLNGAVAAACAVLLAAGPYVVPPAAAFPIGLALGAGHRLVETKIRSWREVLCDRASAALEEGCEVEWEAILLSSMGAHIAATAIFIYASVALAGPAAVWLWEAAPEPALRGLRTAFSVSPEIALATLIHALSRKQ